MSIKLPKLALEIRLRGIGFVVWDVSAVVHGGPKETVGTDYIKQSTNHLLARTWQPYLESQGIGTGATLQALPKR